MKRIGTHVLVFVGFAALAVAWTYPLVLHVSTRLPGAGIGDNALFLWDFWWMRTSRALGTTFFQSPYLFAPTAPDITLHTHAALPAFVGATLLGGVSVASALNLTTLVSLALNGFCAYLLAWRLVGQRRAAILAGLVFGTSSYLAAHLNGHFNLTTAWTLPLFAMGVTDTVRGSIRWALVTGAVMAATVFIDYYYVIYEIALGGAVVLLTARHWTVASAGTPRTRWLLVLVGAALALDLLSLVAIAVTGGFEVELGGVRVSARGTFNLLQAFWVLAAIALWIWRRPRVRATPRAEWSAARAAAGIGTALGTCALLVAPMIPRTIQLFAQGQYVTQQYQWRNAPIGIDVLTLFVGNPFHVLWGGALQALYARLGIDLIESGAWLGVVPAGLALYAIRRRWDDPVVRRWAAVGALFFLWALGSHVHAAGHNIALIGPEALLRYVPIAANARMPGRAMVIVHLALAVLTAAAAVHITGRRSRVMVSALGIVLLADGWIAPFPTASIDCPPIYRVLREQPERGALAELPLGFGDGFGDLTPMDRRMLVCQTVHERPIVGGMLARVPPRVLALYLADPLMATWLRLSGAPADVVADADPADAALAETRMEADDIAFVMLNRRSASPQLRDYVEHVLPLTVVAQDGDRTLYRVVRTGPGQPRN